MTVSYHLAKFSGYRHCRSADINFFHVSPVHIIKRPCDIESWVPAIASYHSAKFGDHRYCVSADIYIYFSCFTLPYNQNVTWLARSCLSSLCQLKENVIFPIPIPIPISMFANYRYSAWTMCIWILLFFKIHAK